MVVLRVCRHVLACLVHFFLNSVTILARVCRCNLYSLVCADVLVLACVCSYTLYFLVCAVVLLYLYLLVCATVSIHVLVRV
jgi:hypothetical protein